MSKKLEEAMAILSELSLDERGQLAAKILLSLIHTTLDTFS
jgi:hypothetical protein